MLVLHDFIDIFDWVVSKILTTHNSGLRNQFYFYRYTLIHFLCNLPFAYYNTMQIGNEKNYHFLYLLHKLRDYKS